MAYTTWATTDNETKKLWSEQIFREAQRQSFFYPYMGTGSENLISVKSDLERSHGDRVRFTLRKRLAGAGVTSAETLEGKDENLRTSTFDVTLEEHAHSVITENPLIERRPVFIVTEEMEMAIRVWTTEKLDSLTIAGLTTTPTRVTYTTNGTSVSDTTALATAKSNLTASSLLFPKMLTWLKTKAMTGLDRTINPLRPFKHMGKNYYFLFIHPDACADLFEDSNFLAARKEAEIRGKENPIFSGAYMIYNGVCIMPHEEFPIGTDAGASSNVPYAQGTLCGLESLCFAWGRRPVFKQGEADRGRQNWTSVSLIQGNAKPKFDSEDWNSLGVMVARSRISDPA